MSPRTIIRSMSTMSKKPLVVIVGATGTGKSQLAIDLARRFDGEVINADAMQLYHGLPIITNKVTEEEKNGVPHHLLGTIGLGEQPWTVGRFVEHATRRVEDIQRRDRLPIVVGGTHYYTQALLFKDGTVDQEPAQQDPLPDEELATAHPILQADTPSILEKLREVDPVMANRWHPNDRRKIQRSLEIFLRTGKTASATYEEQHVAAGELRQPTLVLWLHCDNEVLRKRLDNRVGKMLQAGLLDEVAELKAFHDAQLASGEIIDPTRGIWVSIGYKEFQSYQDAVKSSQAGDRELARLKLQAVEATQAATRQYAKRQIRWIRIKLLNALQATNNQQNMYLLDGTDLELWNSGVLGPAGDFVEAFLTGKEMPDPTLLSAMAKENLVPKRDDMSQRMDLWRRRECEACDAIFVTESSWDKHIKSKGHRYHLKRLQLEAEKRIASGASSEAGQ